MSRHGKRLSVFDRLGPGNDEDLTPPHSGSTSGSRHRHYSAEKHERSHLTLSSDRDKRVSDTQGDRSSRKHRDDVDTASVDNRSTKREKGTPVLRKDMKVVKPPLRGGVSERRDEQTDDQVRLKRKRERESLSDSESHHRDSKRSKTECSLERHYKETKLDNIVHPSYLKKRPVDAFYETEQQNYKSEIDWSVLSSFQCPRPSLKMSSLEKHCSGAIFTDTGISLSLAGPILGQRVLDSVRQHLQDHHQDTMTSELIDEPFGGYSMAGLGAAHLRTAMRNHKQFDIGSCRRALTAGVDFMMRKKCLQKFSPKGNEFAGCFVPYYSASLRLYKN